MSLKLSNGIFMAVREYHNLLCLLNTLSIPTKEKAMDIHNLIKKLKETLTITKETTQPIFSAVLP